VYQLIRERLGPLKALSEKAGAALDENTKEVIGLEPILRQAKELADDYMAGTGFFAGRRDKVVPGLPLQYLHHGKSTAGMTFPGDGKVPEYLAKFDDALRGISTESGQEQLKAVYVFMGKLQKAIRKAVNGQAEHAKSDKWREEAAEKMADAAKVGKGDFRAVLEEVVAKVLRSSKEELDSMPMTDAMNKVLPLQIVLHLAPEVGEEKLNWENFLKHVAKNHEAHFHFVESRAVLFKHAIKKAKRILYNRKKAEEHKAKSAAAIPAEASAAKAAPTAGLAQRLVSMRYD
jgi:hypothetical protein